MYEPSRGWVCMCKVSSSEKTNIGRGPWFAVGSWTFSVVELGSVLGVWFWIGFLTIAWRVVQFPEFEVGSVRLKQLVVVVMDYGLAGGCSR
mmetsp:Transcript_27967/g.43619  ORF Transcript_27967/g.43619 Transcript_27967/m.43619 type:complete len:91 (+) Transcript_27967:124-396(+)